MSILLQDSQAVKSCKDLQVRIVRGQAGTVSGIAKDIEFIKTALRQCGIDNITEVCFDKHVHTTGTALDTVDLQIFIEHTFVDPLIFATVFPARHSIVFVNQEFLHDWDLDLFCAGTAKHAAPIPVCKTRACIAALKEMGVPNPRYLGFGDAVEAPVPGAKVPGFFLHVAGKSPLKGTIALLEAWRLHAFAASAPPQFLIITAFDVDGAMRPFFNLWDSMLADKSASRQANEETGTPPALATAWPANAGPLPEFEVCNFAAGSCIYMCRKMLPAKAIAALGALAAVHVCPSAVEGWGVYIDEGRRAGAVVVTLDAPPMNELVRAGVHAHAGTNAPANTHAPSGILVKAVRGPSLRLLVPKSWLHYAPKLQTAKYKKKFPQSIIYDWPQFRTWLPAPGALAEALGHAAAMDSATAAAYGKAAQEQSRAEAEAFVDNFSLLLEEFGLIAPAAATARTQRTQRTIHVRIIRGGGEASYGLMRDVEFLSRAVTAAAAASNCRVEITNIVFDRSRPIAATADAVADVHLAEVHLADVHLADVQIYIEHVANIRGRPVGGPAKRSYLLVNQEFFHDRDLDFINDGTVTALCKTHEGMRTVSNALETLVSALSASASAPAKRTAQLLSSYKLRTRSEAAASGQHPNSKVLYIGFGNLAPAPPLSIQTKNPDMVLHVMGKSPLKNTRVLVEGWLAAAATSLPGDSINSAFLLIIAYQRDDRTAPFFRYWESLNPVSTLILPQSGILSAKNKIDFVKGIYLCHDRLSDAEIATLGAEAGVHACPSATEGWGQYIDEGRRAGAVVLTLDAPPMNELVTATSGVLIPAVEGPAVQKLLPQSANEWYPRNYWPRTFLPQDTEALAGGIRRALAIARDPEAAAKIGAAAVARSEADAAAFVTAISSIILG